MLWASFCCRLITLGLEKIYIYKPNTSQSNPKEKGRKSLLKQNKNIKTASPGFCLQQHQWQRWWTASRSPQGPRSPWPSRRRSWAPEPLPAEACAARGGPWPPPHWELHRCCSLWRPATTGWRSQCLCRHWSTLQNGQVSPVGLTTCQWQLVYLSEGRNLTGQVFDKPVPPYQFWVKIFVLFFVHHFHQTGNCAGQKVPLLFFCKEIKADQLPSNTVSHICQLPHNIHFLSMHAMRKTWKTKILSYS